MEVLFCAGIVWLLCAIWAANIMSSKGRSAPAGCLLGFVFGIFGVLWVSLLSNKRQNVVYIRES